MGPVVIKKSEWSKDERCKGGVREASKRGEFFIVETAVEEGVVMNGSNCSPVGLKVLFLTGESKCKWSVDEGVGCTKKCC